MNMDQSKEFRETLENKAHHYGVAPAGSILDRLVSYYELLNIWNPRLHLVGPTSPDEFATRHILESLLLLNHLPANAYIADIGSGGGLPIIPCLIARPDIRAVLIESSKKKAVFLREALRQTGTSSQASAMGERFEEIVAPEVGFITCRALERFQEIVPRLIQWAPDDAVFLFFGGEGLKEPIESMDLRFTANLIPNSEKRFLYVVRGGKWKENDPRDDTK